MAPSTPSLPDFSLILAGHLHAGRAHGEVWRGSLANLGASRLRVHVGAVNTQRLLRMPPSSSRHRIPRWRHAARRAAALTALALALSPDRKLSAWSSCQPCASPPPFASPLPIQYWSQASSEPIACTEPETTGLYLYIGGDLR